jgi:hypothetical protein
MSNNEITALKIVSPDIEMILICRIWLFPDDVDYHPTSPEIDGSAFVASDEI